MSVAEVVSMAMARLLVVILKVRGDTAGHTTMLVGSREKIDVEEQTQLFIERNLLTGGRNDGRHVDQGSPC